jgi:putative lipoprotein
VKRLGVIVTAALALAGCGQSGPTPRRVAAPGAGTLQCPANALAGWQKLANRIGAPVYCPTWLPDPLDGVIGSRWNNIDAVDRDRSYLMSWVWQETGPGAAGGELHVNLRGYPGRTRLPRCVNADSKARELIPCFSDPGGKVRLAGMTATVYSVNQDADQWHILYAWRNEGSLYTVSEHVAPPLTYPKVRRYLDRILRGLVRVQPTEQ